MSIKLARNSQKMGIFTKRRSVMGIFISVPVFFKSCPSIQLSCGEIYTVLQTFSCSITDIEDKKKQF